MFILKTIKLVLYRIQHDFSSNKIILTLFLLGSIACTLFFIYFFGTTSTKTVEYSNSMEYRSYEIKLEEKTDYAYAESVIKEIDNISNAEFSTALEDNWLPKEFREGISGNISTCIINNEPMGVIKGRSSFTEEEIKNGAKAIIIPDMINNSIDVGESVKINNINYKIVGQAGFGDFYITPKVYAQNYLVDRINIILKKNISIKESKELLKMLNQKFPHCVAESSPLNYYQMAEEAFPAQMIVFSALYIMFALSFMFIMKFMVDRNSRENIIYSIVGASRKKVIFIAVLESIVLSAVATAVAVIIHISLYDVFFKNINLSENVVYTLGDYILIFLMVIFLSLIVSLPFIIKCCNSSLIESKNKYSEI